MARLSTWNTAFALFALVMTVVIATLNLSSGVSMNKLVSTLVAVMFGFASVAVMAADAPSKDAVKTEAKVDATADKAKALADTKAEKAKAAADVKAAKAEKAKAAAEEKAAKKKAAADAKADKAKAAADAKADTAKAAVDTKK